MRGKAEMDRHIHDLWTQIEAYWLGISQYASENLMISLAAVFLFGVIATLAQARMAILATALFIAARVLQNFELVALPEYTGAALVILFGVGLLQGIATLLLGEQQAGPAVWVMLAGLVVFVIWKFPKTVAVGAAGLLPLGRGGRNA